MIIVNRNKNEKNSYFGYKIKSIDKAIILLNKDIKTCPPKDI